MRRRAEQLNKVTGLVAQEIDCCENSCMAFTGEYSNLNACEKCGYPRWRNELLQIPFKVYIYIPLGIRLQYHYRIRSRAKTLQTYHLPWSTSPINSNPPISDWWSGQRYRDLRRNGFLSESTDIALQMTLDGVGLTQRGPHFSTCPVILLNNNIPPAERFKKRNILLSLIIPGPEKHKNLDSFLFPLIEELKQLGQGVQAYDSYNRRSFILRTHMVVVSGIRSSYLL
jgi:hypothetical protein